MRRSTLGGIFTVILIAFVAVLGFFWLQEGSLEGAGERMDETLAEAGDVIEDTTEDAVDAIDDTIDDATDGEPEQQ